MSVGGAADLMPVPRLRVPRFLFFVRHGPAASLFVSHVVHSLGTLAPCDIPADLRDVEVAYCL